MLSMTALDAGHAIRLCKKGDRYYAAVDGLAVTGIGDDYEAAVAELDRHFGELQSFCEKTGVALDTLAPARPGGASQWASSLRRAAIVVVCFALLTIPFSYALSTALERTVDHLKLRGGRDLWRGIEEGLIKSAGDGSVPTAEEQAKTLAALRVMVRRIQPYADEIRPIFGCTRPQ
jgi:hypothetical protein